MDEPPEHNHRSSSCSGYYRHHGFLHHFVYIHVCDLASGHVAALKAIERNSGLAIYNLGTGHGYSVLDVVNAFMKVNGVNVPYVIKPRRPGDIATCYCNPAKAKAELGWEAQYGIEEMCRDSWNWQKDNPNGY